MHHRSGYVNFSLNIGFSRKGAMVHARASVGKILLIAVLGAAFISGLCSCEQKSDKKDKELLNKPSEKLTREELGRLAVVIRTNMGIFKIGLRPDWAPETARIFVRMVRSGIYDGKQFHEVRPKVWIRGGGPEEDNILAEPVPLEEPPEPVDEVRHHVGAVGLYHPDFMPDKGGVQFYIMLKNNPRMDGGYNAFGEVIEGMGAVKRISNVPVTGRHGQPRPYMPITQVVIQRAYLEMK